MQPFRAARGRTGMNRRKPPRTRCLTLLLLGAATASSMAGAPAAPERPDGYKLEAGPWKAASEDLTLRDNRRQKDLEVTVRYPALAADAAGCFPMVVFSHGAGGSRAAFANLTAHWASHGYIVVLPTHSDSVELRRRRGQDVSYLRRDLNLLIRDVKPFERLADVMFLIDAIGLLEGRVAGLRDGRGSGRVDRDRTGVAGHSAGALTAQMAAGVKVLGSTPGAPFAVRSVGDPRIDAAVVISGQGTTNRMLADASWSELSTPLLAITGSKDVAAIGNETPASRREPFEKAKPGDKYLVFIEGATHSSYQGRGRTLGLDPSVPTDQQLQMITEVTGAATLAFLDLYLKNDAGARAYLRSDALVAFRGMKATLERK